MSEVDWRSGLQTAGWLPRDELNYIAARPSQITGDSSEQLVDAVLNAWQCAFAGDLSSAEHRRGERICNWLTQLRPPGSRLTLGVPHGQEQPPDSAKLSSRLIFWPEGIPIGRWTGILSSRHGRHCAHQSEWIDAFRAACSHAAEQSSVLLSAAKTVTDRFITPAAGLYGLRSLAIVEPRRGQQLRPWLQRLLSWKSSTAHADTGHALVSPLIGPLMTSNSAIDQVPWRDRALASLADQLFVIHVRRGGNVERLVRMRLREYPERASDVFILTDSPLVPEDLIEEFLDLGASAVRSAVAGTLHVPLPLCELTVGRSSAPSVGRSSAPSLCGHLEQRSQSEGAELRPTIRSRRQCDVGTQPGTLRHTECAYYGEETQILDSVPDRSSQYLIHCTREQRGPWPDQSEPDYVCEMLMSQQLPQRTALASLRRIVERQRIVATRRLFRGRVPAVSLSAIPLAELRSRRVFRPHQGRWDFEPFGIYIDRDWLLERRTRPVIYGDDDDWQELSADDRMYFQTRFTSGRRTGRVADWATENEWRHPGDLDLSELAADRAYLFVPSRADAESLAVVSRWKIIVLDG